MRKLTYLMAAAAVGGLALTTSPTMAAPLTGLSGVSSAPEVNESLVHKVHRFHCKRRYGWFRGDKRWHRHRRACHYSYYPYHSAPVFSFGLFIDDDDGRHHRKFRRHKQRKSMY